MDASQQNYFANVRTTDEKTEESFPSQGEVEAMKALVSGVLSVDQAAKRLTRRTTDAPTPFAMDMRHRTLFDFVNKTAVAVPSAQPLIVDLLLAIRRIGRVRVPEEGEGAGWGLDLDGLWEALPHWGDHWADKINACHVNFLNDCENAAATVDWVATTAFTARLVATRDPELGVWFFLYRCSQSIIRVLEIDPSAQPRRHRNETVAAAQLFIHASPELLARSRQGDELEGISKDELAGAYSWSGDVKKMSEGRWAYWKERWAALKGLQGLDADARKAAAAALQAMIRAEEGQVP